MKVHIHSTSKDIAGYVNLGPIVSDQMIEDVCLTHVTEPITEVILNNVLCFFDVKQCSKIFEKIVQRLPENGKITVYCLDIYNLAQALHRRTINEVEFNNFVLKKNVRNCFGPMFIIEIAKPYGLILEECVLDNFEAKVVLKK